MKRSDLRLRPATVAEARAILGLENQPTLAAQVRRSLRRQRKAKNRAKERERRAIRRAAHRAIVAFADRWGARGLPREVVRTILRRLSSDLYLQAQGLTPVVAPNWVRELRRELRSQKGGK
jgi:hypothetical protein